MFLHWAQWRAC